MTTIGIIGAGIAGLHHALFLQKHGIQVTLYTDRSADELRKSRLPNTVALMGTTRSREIELGINHWDKPELRTHLADISIAGDHPIAFRSSILEPLIFIDMRLYVPTLMADFEKLGGKTVVVRCSPEEVGKLAADHDLMVVTTGRAGLTAMFPRIAERSPYHEPQRRLFAGLFRGVSLPSPFTFNFNIIPGLGEVFESQFVTHDGPVTGITIEAVPGGALEALTHLVYDDDPAAFNAAVLAVLRAHAPATYARIDPAAFALTGPLDTLSGAVVPTARRAWAALPGGRFAIAIGDTHIAHDPITGLGANTASRGAWLLGQLVVEHTRAGGRFDEAFCAVADQRLWEMARSATEWTNAFLQPPPQHVVDVFVAAAQNSKIADALVGNFNYPDRQWQILSSPDSTAAFISSFGPASA